MVTGITVEGGYKNIKWPSEVGTDNAYRITKISSDLTVSITTEADESAEPETGYAVTFVTDENCSAVTVYKTQTISDSNQDTANADGTYYARNSDSGLIDTSGEGQINFVVTPAEGYAVSGVTADANCKNIKEVDTNTYCVTKITGDVTITITTGEDSSEEPAAYYVTFETDEHCRVTVYKSQEVSESNTDTANDDGAYSARNGSTGEVDVSGSGQVNLVIEFDDGYMLESIAASGNCNQIKEVSDYENAYRVTKITGDLTVTITTAEGASGKLTAGTETVAWTYEEHTLTATGDLSDTAFLVVSGYDSNGKMLSVGIISASGGTVSVSSDTAEVRLFWLNGSYAPKCAHVSFSG